MLAATHGRPSNPLKQRQAVGLDQPSRLAICPPARLSNSPAVYVPFHPLAICLSICHIS